MLRIHYTFTCVLNYPYFPWCCVFNTLSHVFWIYTHTSPGLAYSLHFQLCCELCPYFPWCCVFVTLSSVFWITHTSLAYSLHFHMCFKLSIPPLVLCILNNLTCVLNYPYSPWCCVFTTLSHVFWITHTSPGVAYSIHCHLCFELPTFVYFPWSCVFSTLSHVFWITHNSPGLSCVFSTLSHVFWIYTHTSLGLAYFLHFQLCCELCPYFPWYCVFFTLSSVFWITHTSLAYLLHFHMCFKLSIPPLVLCILDNLTCVLNYPYYPWCCVFSSLSHVFWITHTSPGVAYSIHFHLCFELPIIPLVLRILYTFTCVLNNP